MTRFHHLVWPIEKDWIITVLELPGIPVRTVPSLVNFRQRSEGDNVLGSVRPSVRLSVRLSVDTLTAEPVQGYCLCVCNQWAYVDNCADAVDRLLI